MGRGARVPWWAKILTKILLSRLPLGYDVWRKLGLFRHGTMDATDYATSVFALHRGAAEEHALLPRDFVSLEIGPGDSLFGAIIARASGAFRAIAVDVGHFAGSDISRYEALAGSLGERTFTFSATTSFDDFLALNRISYLTEGLASLRSIPDGSVDFIWSHAALEHVPRVQFRPMLDEMKRVLRSNGVMSHTIDLADHLGGALNNLRVRESIWESRLFRTSGFYTNRLRFREILSAFAEAGFEACVKRLERWSELPTPLEALSPEFRTMPLDELLILGLQLTAWPQLSAVDRLQDVRSAP